MHATSSSLRRDATTAAGFTLVMAAFFIWLLSLGGGLPSFSHTYQVRTVLPTSASLAPGARVTMAGIEIGRVTDVRRLGVAAQATLQLDDDRVTPLPDDSRISVRERTPVGENYVSIIPGDSETTLRSGSVLPAQQADEYVDVDQILSVLQGPTRARTRELLQGAGDALAGQGRHLNDLLGGTATTLHAGGRLTTVLDGDRRRLSTLVQNLGDVAAAVGDRDEAIATLATRGLTTFRAVAERDQALRSLLRSLPPTLDRVRRTTATLGTASDRATPVLADLSAAAAQLRPAVDALRPAAQIGREAMRELDGAAPKLQRTLAQLNRISGPASAALPVVRKSLCQVNPMLRYMKPYTADLMGPIVGLGSTSNFYDATGHGLRLLPIISENSMTALPPDLSAAAHTLLHAGLLAKSSGLTYDPFPKPGQIGKATAQTVPRYIGPEDFAKRSGYKYPRIQADC